MKTATKFWMAVALATALSTGWAGPTPADAALTRGQQACVTALQKDLAKTDKQVTRQVHSCLKSFAKGRINSPDFCVGFDPRGKIQRFKDKTTADFALRCTEPPVGKLEDPFPSFGARSASTVNEEAQVLGEVLAHDIFGNRIEWLTADEDKAGAKCQQKVWKAVTKCEQMRLKEFQKCSRKGLRGLSSPGLIDSAADMRDLCLGIGPADQPDPRRRISRKCGDPDRGIERMITRTCGDVFLPDAFPECGSLSAAGTARCLNRKVSCRVCMAMNRSSGLTRDCDLMDDGFANLSCACGDGILNAAELCDDGNNVSGDGCGFACQLEID